MISVFFTCKIKVLVSSSAFSRPIRPYRYHRDHHSFKNWTFVRTFFIPYLDFLEEKNKNLLIKIFHRLFQVLNISRLEWLKYLWRGFIGWFRAILGFWRSVVKFSFHQTLLFVADNDDNLKEKNKLWIDLKWIKRWVGNASQPTIRKPLPFLTRSLPKNFILDI